MGDKTSIEWTDATWNPIIGCSRVGPGCDHCYAIGVVHREMSPQHVGLTVKPEGGRTDWTGEVRPAGERKLTEPLRWTRPRRIFVNSLSDLFHADLPDDEIAKVFAVMALAPQHTFQVLTKRPQRMAKLLASPQFERDVASWAIDVAQWEDAAWSFDWPLPNVHLGVSIENDTYTWRADHLRNTPAAVRFVSAEPLLGPLPSLDLTGIDWLIVGGESGPGSRPMHPAWVRDLRDRTRMPNVDGDGNFHPLGSTAFLFKQWGDWVYGEGDAQAALGDDGFAAAAPWAGRGRLHYWDDDLDPSYRVGKKAAGRELDGRTWDEYPATKTVTEA